MISQETAQNNKIGVGDQISLDLGDLVSQSWLVIGTYKVIYGSGFVVEPIYAPLATVHQTLDKTGLGTQALISGSIQTLAAEEAFADELKTLFENQGIDLDYYTTAARLEQRQYANNQFNSIISMLLVISISSPSLSV